MQARLLRCIAIAMLTAAFAGLWSCASSPSSQGVGLAADLGSTREEASTLPGKPGCFRLSDFNGSWTVLNDGELVVYAPLYSRPYLVKLFDPVPTLRFHERLGFADVEGTGMICDGTIDELVVPHWEPHRVPIVAVRELTVPQARRLLAENHIKPPRGQRPGKGNPSATR